jgi:hypothetical protein
MRKKITGSLFVVILTVTSSSAVAEEPGPSVAPSPPAVLAQSPAAGVIAAATPIPTPAVAPSPAATLAFDAASPTATPSVNASPAAASATPAAVPTPASTFRSELLGGQEPELDAEERAGVEITDAWRQKSYESVNNRQLKQAACEVNRKPIVDQNK